MREPWEFELCRIDGSMSIPLGEIARRIGELPRDRPLVLVCHHGGRSQHAATLLAGAGFAEVHNLAGRRRGVGARRRSDDEAILSRYASDERAAAAH